MFRNSPRPRAIDLFAGAGGMSLGLKAAGFDVLGVEMNETACLTHVHQVGPCLCMDVRLYSPPARGISLLASGAPCTEYTQAGPKGGLAVPRGRLYQEHIRCAVEASAPMVLMENVTDILTTVATRGSPLKIVDVIVGDFRAAGYHMRAAEWNAAEFGLPQRRRRVFLVGARDPAMIEAFVFPKPTHGPGGWPQVTARQASGIPYDRPAPPVTATESKSLATPKKDRPGTGGMRRSHERMVEELGGPIERPSSEQWQLLQGFPTSFRFEGTKEERITQIGNAVPPPLALMLGSAIRRALSSAG